MWRWESLAFSTRFIQFPVPGFQLAFCQLLIRTIQCLQLLLHPGVPDPRFSVSCSRTTLALSRSLSLSEIPNVERIRRRRRRRRDGDTRKRIMDRSAKREDEGPRPWVVTAVLSVGMEAHEPQGSILLNSTRDGHHHHLASTQ